MFSNVYAGRRVLVTGHTGFKGSWLCTWLLELGADVAGYSLDIPTEPSNFEILALSERLRHYQGDVRDREQLGRVFDEFRPEIVFHLAAQSLVRRSYCDPVTTFETNAIGTLNVLECMRQRAGVGVGVIITSDKCYRNLDWTWGYRENDALGGADPYSGSKGCAELITYSYVRSFFNGRQGAAAIATARGGNVIGGGDWAEDGLVPDCVRAWSKGDAAVIRHPDATRPWQYVLDALSGYLWLGSQLWRRNPQVVGESYNFGPDAAANHRVEVLLRMIAEDWPAARWRADATGTEGRPEARVLKLSTDKALADLEWRTALTLPEAVHFTTRWYRRYYEQGGADMGEFAVGQIGEYRSRATERGLAWTT